MKHIFLKWIGSSVPWLIFAMVAGWAGYGHADGLFTFADAEKPKPEFTRESDVIVAKLIPRAKSTSVVIRFAVPYGGHLAAVKGVDFMSIDRPEVDVKNFKSAAFEINIDRMIPGAKAKVAVSSDFFSSSTAFYVFNAKRQKPWIVAKVDNIPRRDRVRELQITVKDGGSLDGDGSADGQITLTGGPRDSFWGYALGTLFIRFFGIFIVLSILMIGMLLSGFFFSRLKLNNHNISTYPSLSPEKTVKKSAAGAADQIDTAYSSSNPTEEEAAVIATALHCYFNPAGTSTSSQKIPVPVGDTWTQEGRKRIMQERLMVFNKRLN